MSVSLPADNGATPRGKKTKSEGWVHVGYVAVDSARLILCDPLSIDHLPLEVNNWPAFGSIKNSHGVEIAYVSGTGWGDGSYPVEVLHNDGGRVAQLRVTFIEVES